MPRIPSKFTRSRATRNGGALYVNWSWECDHEHANAEIALITGGSRGLGRNTAASLVCKGVDAVITYHSRADEGRTVVAAIEAQGRKAIALQLDTAAVETFDHSPPRSKARCGTHGGETASTS